MKFKFSLNSVLKVRKHQKELEKHKLAKEVGERQHICDVKQKVQSELNEYLEKNENSEISNIHMIRMQTAHIQNVQSRMKNLSEDISKMDVKVDEQRAELAKAHQNLHVIEKVKESEEKSFFEYVSREEQKTTDEIATQSYSR